MAGKQANEVCSTQKLSLERTQQAIMSVSLSQSKSSTVTAGTREGADRAVSRNDKEKATPEGKERAGSEMRMSTPQLVRIRLILKCQALFCSLNATAVISKLGPFFLRQDLTV